MRILLLTHSFNSLAQRFYTVLEDAGHDISVEFDINDSVTAEAVDMFRPELIIAPYLRRKIHHEITSKVLCWIVHPGPAGDRGPSALDWAILNGESIWGTTILEAVDEYDAGPIWASADFPMRNAAKSSIYRREVSNAAVICLKQALEKLQKAGKSGFKAQTQTPGRFVAKIKNEDRKIDWENDTVLTVLRKIWSADGSPGILDEINASPFYLHDACRAEDLKGIPGKVLGLNSGAVAKAAADGAVWIKQLRPLGDQDGRGIKLPAAEWITHFGLELPVLKQTPAQEITFETRDGIGYFHFPFYNGAMDTAACEKLRKEICLRKTGPEKVWVFTGGSDFWSNGLHLGKIEQAQSPAHESKNNIEAMNALVKDIIYCTNKYIVAALAGNAAAGGVFFSLSADKIIGRDGIVLNPHYRNMGNLYGSEYWTYLLPRRLKPSPAQELMHRRLPISAKRAHKIGLIDLVLEGSYNSFTEKIHDFACSINNSQELSGLLQKKHENLQTDNTRKNIESYRQEEMEKMNLNFFGFDPSYHIARYNFIRKQPLSWTPLYLAKHRTKNFDNNFKKTGEE